MPSNTPAYSDNRIRLLAALITLLVGALIFFWLWLVQYSFSIAEPPQKVSHELMALNEEDELLDMEEFIEPPIEVPDAGEPNPMTQNDDSAAPSPTGEPQQSPVKSDKVSVSDKNPNPNNSADKQNPKKNESDLKTVTPSPKEQPDSKITSDVKNKFNNHNGTPDGATADVSGSSATGTDTGSVQGVLDGKRKLLSCNNKLGLKVSKKITVIVDVTVNDQGKVLTANCRTQVAANIRQKVETAAKGSTWTPKAGAPVAKGTLTFTIIPTTK